MENWKKKMDKVTWSIDSLVDLLFQFVVQFRVQEEIGQEVSQELLKLKKVRTFKFSYYFFFFQITKSCWWWHNTSTTMKNLIKCSKSLKWKGVCIYYLLIKIQNKDILHVSNMANKEATEIQPQQVSLQTQA